MDEVMTKANPARYAEEDLINAAMTGSNWWHATSFNTEIVFYISRAHKRISLSKSSIPEKICITGQEDLGCNLHQLFNFKNTVRDLVGVLLLSLHIPHIPGTSALKPAPPPNLNISRLPLFRFHTFYLLQNHVRMLTLTE